MTAPRVMVPLEPASVALGQISVTLGLDPRAHPLRRRGHARAPDRLDARITSAHDGTRGTQR
jgi:hypothetical protein